MAKLLILLCLTAVSSLNAVFQYRIHPGRIIGGLNATEGSFPYQVSLQEKDTHVCGGSILSKDYVLTAAHCIVGHKLANMKAVVGITKLSDGGSKHAILEAHVHKHWNDKKIKNDIAVIKVKEITFSSKVAPISLDASESLTDGLDCTVSGWGLSSYPKPVISPNHLQYINLTTISFKKCKKMNNHKLVDNKKEICTLTKVGEGVCVSDSGGPLVRNVDGVRKQIGIVSWGKGCGDGFPDVYVRISSYIDWLQNKCNFCIENLN